jgi:thiamine-phosphate pyrophosphorylase
VDTVQLRVRRSEKDDLGLFAVAMRVREMTAGRARFIMTGDIELAEKCHADGVLLPERSYKPSEAREYLRGTIRLVGAFVQSVNGASRAERGGADYVQVGPAFPDSPEDKIGGLGLIRKIKDAVQISVIAFGGVATAEQVADAVQAGADGVAVTEAITKAADPMASAAALRAALDAAWRVAHDGQS